MSGSTLAPMPLYARVRSALTERLIAGTWSPGTMLPSEQKIADELGVSQGTVRKALDEMTLEGLLRRQQGRGTFVAEAEDQAILFKFYRLTPDKKPESNEDKFPQSVNLGLDQAAPTAEVIAAFGAPTPESLWRLERLRLLDDKPFLWEEIFLPEKRFPLLDQTGELPNNLYRLFSDSFGVTVSGVREELRAVAASKIVARHLSLQSGEPMLEITRSATALDGQIVEVRRSLCHTEQVHYLSTL